MILVYFYIYSMKMARDLESRGLAFHQNPQRMNPLEDLEVGDGEDHLTQGAQEDHGVDPEAEGFGLKVASKQPHHVQDQKYHHRRKVEKSDYIGDDSGHSHGDGDGDGHSDSHGDGHSVGHGDGHEEEDENWLSNSIAAVEPRRKLERYHAPPARPYRQRAMTPWPATNHSSSLGRESKSISRQESLKSLKHFVQYVL